MATETPNDMVPSSPSVQAGSVRSAGAAYMVGVAFRPTLLFMTAFALNVTPHEAAHAVASYMLGFNSTLYQMWVNPDAAAATPRQLIAIAVAGPLFSLTMGLVSSVLYLPGGIPGAWSPTPTLHRFWGNFRMAGHPLGTLTALQKTF
jgi:hypothetical protein